VDLFALTLLRLIGTKHVVHSFRLILNIRNAEILK
jgi:hypothetical protein